MEHKLIQGGEQFLSFARSRIKALRAAGLKHASQSFEVDGASIKVRVVGEHEYIELRGGDPLILSGVTKDGEVVELPAPPGSPEGTLPKKTLRSYKPTQNAWDVPITKNPERSPGAFNDEARLSRAGAQYANLRPTMFSGRMVQVVQILMGRGLEVKYDFRWIKCHGVTKGPDGTRWLVEVSDGGVRAMKLGLSKGNESSKCDAVREATLMFGGVPNGKTFPTGVELTEAAASGAVVTLRTSAGMVDFYEKRDFTSTMGWSFNDDGTEAHNTCWQAVTPGLEEPDLESADTIFTSYHYKLSINFFTNGDPPVAELEMVTSGRLTKKQHSGSQGYQPIPLYLYDFLEGVERPIWQQRISSTQVDVISTAPLIACHLNNALEVISVRVRSSTEYDYTTTVDSSLGPYTIKIFSYNIGRTLTFPSYDPEQDDYTLSSISYATPFISGYNGYDKHVGFTVVTTTKSNTSGYGLTCLWGAYARDSFVVLRPPSTLTVDTGAAARYVYDGPSAGVSREVSDATGPRVLVSDIDGIKTGYNTIYVPNAVQMPYQTITTTERVVKFFFGAGQSHEVVNDAVLLSLPYVYLTYSAFGSSEQQVSVSADGYHLTLGGLLSGELATNPRKEFTFIGYT